jgi:hypothetical protein
MYVSTAICVLIGGILAGYLVAPISQKMGFCAHPISMFIIIFIILFTVNKFIISPNVVLIALLMTIILQFIIYMLYEEPKPIVKYVT